MRKNIVSERIRWLFSGALTVFVWIGVRHYQAKLYLLTYSFTPRSRVILEKLTVFQQVKFPALYGTGRFTIARHLSLS